MRVFVIFDLNGGKIYVKHFCVQEGLNYLFKLVVCVVFRQLVRYL